MRVSDHMMTNSILRGINDSKTRMNKFQQQISSGKKLLQSSDDPFAFAKSARYKALIEKNDQYLRSINLSMGFVEATQSGLENINNLIQNAKEKATQGADDSLSSEDRQAIAQEVGGIMDEIITQLNGQFDGENLFSGTNTDIADAYQFEENGVPQFIYNGNNQQISQKFGEYLELSINITDEQINAEDILTKLYLLKTQLESNNGSGNGYWDSGEEFIDSDSNGSWDPGEEFTDIGVDDFIDEMDSLSENLMSVITKMGDIHNRISLTEQQLTMANMNLSSYMSSLEDADMAEAVLHYNSEEVAYRASLQSSSNIMMTSLLDYIR